MSENKCIDFALSVYLQVCEDLLQPGRHTLCGAGVGAADAGRLRLELRHGGLQYSEDEGLTGFLQLTLFTGGRLREIQKEIRFVS